MQNSSQARIQTIIPSAVDRIHIRQCSEELRQRYPHIEHLRINIAMETTQSGISKLRVSLVAETGLFDIQVECLAGPDQDAGDLALAIHRAFDRARRELMNRETSAQYGLVSRSQQCALH